MMAAPASLRIEPAFEKKPLILPGMEPNHSTTPFHTFLAPLAAPVNTEPILEPRVVKKPAMLFTHAPRKPVNCCQTCRPVWVWVKK